MIKILGLLSLSFLVVYGFDNREQILCFFRKKGLYISVCSYISCFAVHLAIYVINIEPNDDKLLSNLLPVFSVSFSLIAALLFFIASVSFVLHFLSIVLGYKK